jgi:Ca2+/Na+ antiporter
MHPFKLTIDAFIQVVKGQKWMRLCNKGFRSREADRVEVDMLKLRYDYIFSLNMINTLSVLLKIFMTRDGLVEMLNYDKLGTKEGPGPLLFLKYMIDMQDQQGLWNLVSVVGERFYVSNEVDAAFKPAPEQV